jgi:hypothetical protein
MLKGGSAGLTITYQVPGLSPLSVATVEDDGLLRQAGQLALEQAEERAAAIASEDPVMGMLQAAEVRRLRAALSVLIPGFRPPSTLRANLQ